jgi:hypothetical protein
MITNGPLGQCNALRDCATDGLRQIHQTLQWGIDHGYGNVTYEEGRKSAFLPI